MIRTPAHKQTDPAKMPGQYRHYDYLVKAIIQKYRAVLEALGGK
jgi:hypothetical protein